MNEWSPGAALTQPEHYGVEGSVRFLLMALVATAFARPASADEIQNVRSLDVAVNGSIREHCAMGSVADMDFGNLERRSLGFQTQVALDCNVPFTMTIKGARGALTHTTMPNGQGPFGGAVPYSLAVQMPVRYPATQVLSKTFGSQQLQSGGVISSNGGIATDGMVLGVQLGMPSGEAGLLAGEYTETITITVSPI
ncbi:hypothetical protein [Altererythrobacter sp. Root672]|uniref:hypothetical protein n=1 Tax=Altererythrobacter sp. Root672 TaxID=1736584 RepID=UPI001F2D66B9|nr:hypothetical protein [Altererythrobacter sp. Root672]